MEQKFASGEMKQPSTWLVFKPHLRVWRLFGLLPPVGPKKCYRHLYLLYAVLLNICITLIFPITLLVNCLLSKNVNDFCMTLYSTITDVACNLKFLNVFVMRKQLLKLRPILRYLDSRACSQQEQQALQAGIASARLVFITLFRIYSCACFTSQLVVFLSKERNLMFPAWLPWNWQSSKRNFYYAHAYQTVALAMAALLNLSNDTYPQAYMEILRAHIKALSIRVRQLGVSQQKDALDTCSQQQREEELYEQLVACIQDHTVIINLFDIMDRTISSAAFIQFICTGAAQCTIGVYMLYVGLDNISKLLNFVVFFIAITMEIYILCYYGDLLYHENELLMHAIYSCNWMDQSKRFKVSLQLMLQRAQKTKVVMAGKVIPVRLPTFLRVIKTAYSLFTVLNNLK